MPAKPDRLHAAEFPRLQVSTLDQGFQFSEFGDDLFLRSVEEDTIIPFAVLVPTLGEVRIVLRQFLIFKMRQLPLTLAEGVQALGELLQQGERDLLPETDFLKRVALQFFGRDKKLIPALIGKETSGAACGQVEV